MTVINKLMLEMVHVVARTPDPSSSSIQSTPTSTAPPSASSSATGTGGGSQSTTQSPLLFFVALGFGVVFTNLWIIVGVKYCFRYNARNRALARGEDGEPINLENMPRPHRRRREKKLMTMDEVNERFPLTKYKAWVAARASEGLPTAGGVAVSPGKAASLKEAEGIVPSSPSDSKKSAEDRPATAASTRDAPEITVSSPTNALGGSFPDDKKTIESPEEASAPTENTYLPTLAEVDTTATADADKADEEEEDEEDHIHDALPPELLTTPGDSCAICIDTIEDDDDIRGLTCGHAFHAGCLDPWLTSRRACCPLCKADYYTPKPRPEGEAAAEADRPRRSGRLAMPTPPSTAWTGIRGSPRMILPSRGFMSNTLYNTNNYGGPSGRARRARSAAALQASLQAQSLESAPPTDDNNAAAAGQNNRGFASRLRSANPFSTRWMPHNYLGASSRRVGNNADVESGTGTTEPAQLESVVIR